MMLKKVPQILFFLLLFSSGVEASDIYWKPTSGNDSNNGLTATAAVKTFAKAKALLSAQTSGSIILCESYAISSNTTLDGQISSTRNAEVKRNNGFTAAMLNVTAGTLTLKNITLTGTNTPSATPVPMIYVSGKLYIESGTLIKDNDRSGISGTGAGSAIRLYADAELVMNGGTIQDCKLYGPGAAIYAVDGAKVTINGGLIQRCNITSSTGGAIFITSTISGKSSILDLAGGTIKNCSSITDGGAVSCTSTDGSTTVNLKGTKIEGCTSVRNGGGLHIKGANTAFNMTNGEITGCTASTFGGGVYFEESSIGSFSGGSIHDCSATSETTTGRGGGIATNGTNVITMNNASMQVYGNHAKFYGGGIHVGRTSTFNFSAGKIYSNTADAGAAGVHVTTSLLNMSGGEIYNNVSNGLGGGIHSSYRGTMSIAGGKIYNNTAKNQGGGFNMNTNTTLIFPEGSTVEVYGNKSTRGGAVMLDMSDLYIYSGKFYDNHAVDNLGSTYQSCGGAFYLSMSVESADYEVRPATAYIGGGEIYENTAVEAGGFLYMSENTLHPEVGNSRIIVRGGYIHENQCNSGNGGAVYAEKNAIFDMGSNPNDATKNPILSNNTAKFGGAAYLTDAIFSLTAGTISSNAASEDGGGFYIGGNATQLEISGGSVTNNEAGNNGGGFAVVGAGTIDIYQKSTDTLTSIAGNQAGNFGGGFYASNGTVTISDGGLTGNEALSGGGIYLGGGTMTVNGGSINGNTATQNGGGIYTAGTITVENGTINGNAAAAGGGVYIPAGSTLNMYGAGSICNNTITGTNGGGVYQAGTMNVAGSSITVTGNTNAGGLPNNVFLPNYDNVITIVDHGTYHGVTDATDIGISIPKITDNVGVPVIASEEPDYLWGIVEKLTNPLEPSALKDDRNMYQVVYTSSEPYNDEQIFFVPTWQAGCAEDALFQDSEYEGVNPIEISTNKQLAKFMCYVNGLNGFSPHPTANGKLMADVDMDDYIWLPMGTIDISHTYEHGTPSPYAGTFDGNGYVITGLRNPGLAGYYHYGLFGETNGATVQNTFVIGCYFEPKMGGSHIGCIIGTMTGGTLAYSEGVGNLEMGDVMGGLVGVASGATIHSSMAMANLWGYNLGGLVGQTDATTTVKNCFANSATQEGIYSKTINAYEKMGGLVGINAGTVENCYVLWERLQADQAYKFAGKNLGTITSCYAPSGDNLVGEGTAPVSYGIFHAPKAPYYYADQTGDNDIYEGTANIGSTLTDALNAWVSTNGTQYTTWRRTMAGGSSYSSYGDINHDYPIPTFDAQGYTTVGACAANDFGDPEYSHDGIVLDYFTSIDQVLTRHNDDGILEGGTLNLYKNDEATQGTDEGVVVYIDENVSFLQTTSEAITAVTCQTMTKPNETWHLISSSLSASPIGFTYGTTSQVAWQDDVIGGTNNPCNVSLNSSHASSLFPTDAPVSAIDLYSFSEPYYHWINLKRNSSSHWHMNAHEKPITYTNETELAPAKGYLAAIDKAVLLEASGTLNNGEITIGVTTDAGKYNGGLGIPATEGTERMGYNLLGNPYQSYLDFATFASVNSSLWDGSATFALYDAETDTYTQGSATTSSKGSYAASGDINMHQGFFILADNAGTATFNNTMRSNTPASGTSFRGEERPAFPLINLKVTGDDGTNDVAVVEFDRPEYSAAAKMKYIGGNGKLYFRYNNEDCALLYLDEDIDNLPVRFETVEDGTYTLTWSTANATFSYLHLIDNMTGMDIDMLTSEGYTFQSTTSDYASRFKLVFAYTGVEEESETATEHFAFVSNGNLIVNGTGMFEMIDMNGRVISATRLSDAQNTVALPNAAAGVYVLKLTDSASSKVQKVVIR